jgi:anti-sigma factor RsiW
MVVNCEHVWQEISNYLEGDVDAGLRAAMEDHLRGCKHCSAVLDGTRNVIELYGDERALEIPLGFSQRLHRRLAAQMPQERRGNAFGWMVAFAAACLLIAGVAIGRSSAFSQPPVRSKLAAPAVQVPPGLMVVVYDSGKTFHAPGCSVIHDKQHARIIPAELAIKEGFVPCTRCMKQYLGLNAQLQNIVDDREEIAEAIE